MGIHRAFSIVQSSPSNSFLLPHSPSPPSFTFSSIPKHRSTVRAIARCRPTCFWVNINAQSYAFLPPPHFLDSVATFRFPLPGTSYSIFASLFLSIIPVSFTTTTTTLSPTSLNTIPLNSSFIFARNFPFTAWTATISLRIGFFLCIGNSAVSCINNQMIPTSVFLKRRLLLLVLLFWSI